MLTVNLKNLSRIEMSINTPFNVTLTEGQIGVILCSLENSTKYADSEYIEEVDGIFEILEGAVDKYYNKLEAAKKKKGSGEPNRDKVATVSWDQVKKIAEDKMIDLNAFTVESAMKMVAGTARSMGIKVNGGEPPVK